MNWFERGWYRQHKWIYLLLPLSLLFWILSALRRLLFKSGIKKSVKLNVPVIVVGNITVGGTGKTPFVIWLVEQLQAQGLKPGVINRGYGGEFEKTNHLLGACDLASAVGDEAKLIYQNTRVPVAVGRDRIKSGQLLIGQGCNVLVCDDGLQHYKLARDLEVILIDGSRGLGNQCLLPAGPLREGLWRLKTTPLVIQNGQQSNAYTGYYFTTQAQSPVPVRPNQNKPFDPAAGYFAVCGIGNPHRFYQTLADKKIHLLEKYSFIDHHQFTLSDFSNCRGAGVIMTEKDAVKCEAFALENWWYLPISIAPDPAFIDVLLNQLTKIRTQYDL